MRGEFVEGVVESEDCLYLNIWVPRATLDSVANGSSTGNLSVYVFIHGGGFVGGNSMQNLYNGTIMSGVNNIVFASIQYRLGSLGFAYFGKNDDAPGNAGLWDQLEALKWISENVGAFGGNKSAVTLGGESAGAVSVTYHLLSPYSRKYFQQAIIESGAALATWAFHTPDIASTVTNIVLNQTASTGKCNLPLPNNAADKLKCLRSVDSAVIANADLAPLFLGFGFGSTPVIDGDFVPRDPNQMLSAGDFYKVPLLIGANREEGSLFLITNPELSALLPGEDNPKASLDNLNYTHYDMMMELAFYIMAGVPFPNGVEELLLNAVKLHYWPSSDDGGLPNGSQISNAVVQATGDYSLTCPTYIWANKASTFLQNATGSNQVYVYHFSQRSAADKFPQWMGVVHGEELIYVFGEPLAPYAKDYGYSFDDRLLSKTMMEYWGNFIKYGDPNVRDEYASCDVKTAQPIGPGSCKLRNWPTYSGDKNCPYQFSELNVITQVFNYGSAVSCGHKARDCKFWSEVFPKITRLVATNSQPKGN